MAGELTLTTLTENQTGKEATVNEIAGQLEAAVAGRLALDVSAGNAAVTDAQMRRASAIVATGAGVARTVTLGAATRILAVANSGTATVTFARGTTSFDVLPGKAATLILDGTANGMFVAGGGGGALAFTGLTDVPIAYTGAANKLVVVNGAGNGLAFVTPPDLSNFATKFTDLDDAPSALTGSGGKFVAVKADASGLELVAAPSGGGGSGLPAGGTARQVLAKNSATSGDASWADIASLTAPLAYRYYRLTFSVTPAGNGSNGYIGLATFTLATAAGGAMPSCSIVSGGTQYAPWFDNDDGTAYEKGGTSDVVIVLDFTTAKTFVEARMKPMNGYSNETPNRVVIEASNDGTNFTTTDTLTFSFPSSYTTEATQTKTLAAAASISSGGSGVIQDRNRYAPPRLADFPIILGTNGTNPNVTFSNTAGFYVGSAGNIQGGDNWRCAMRALSGTSWTVISRMLPVGPVRNLVGAAFILRNSSNGKMIIFGNENSTRKIQLWNSQTSYGGTLFSGYSIEPVYCDWYKIVNDNGNLSFYLSANGINWVLMCNTTIAGFIGAVDQVGFGTHTAHYDFSQIGANADDEYGCYVSYFDDGSGIAATNTL